MGDTRAQSDSIEKFERTGTRPIGSNLTIADAIKFHNAIGSKRKMDRLSYLKNYWLNRVKDVKGVLVNTPQDMSKSCAIANIGIKGITSDLLADTLYQKYRIFTVAIDHGPVHGVRITPHLYTSIGDLDTLVKAIQEMAAS